uniref:hypothetical protein n=1 Tax=Candidatus Fimenecus sp. TaxID=3022888 RepID=UPI004025BFD6
MYLTIAQDPQAIADYVPIKQITAGGVAVPDKIQNDVCYTDGRICYHRRTGRHARHHLTGRHILTYLNA